MTASVRIQVRVPRILKTQLSDVGQRTATRLAVEAFGIEMQRGLMRRTPVRTGRLRTGWQRGTARGIRGGFRMLSHNRARIANVVEYASAVDEGTPPHIIRPKSRKALRWHDALTASGRPRRGSRAIFARQVSHPGTRPQNMVARTIQLDSNRSARAAERAVRRWLRRTR